jgi:hypothetical protein
MKHEVTCTTGVVWILVTEDGAEPPPARLADSMPEGICVQFLKSSGGRTFWEGRTITVLSYLNAQPGVELVILTDTDVLVNNLKLTEIKDRFQKLTTPTARVVVSMEQTCWFARPCEEEVANDWLRAVRGNSSGLDDLNYFANSQYMGEADAVKAMLRRGLEVNPWDDQAALGIMIKENASVFALDHKEMLFASMSRGVTANPEGNWMCNFGGDNSTKCDITTSQWGWCNYTEGRITITGGGSKTSLDGVTPLVMHMNGLSPWCLGNGENCREIFRNASGGEL